MRFLRRRLRRLETISVERSRSDRLRRVPPFPDELAGSGRNAFREAVTLHYQGRESEFIEKHQAAWRLWQNFDKAVQESESPIRIQPLDWLL